MKTTTIQRPSIDSSRESKMDRWVKLLAGTAILAGGLHFLLCAYEVSSSSLWEDEIGTIFMRTLHGWSYVLQDYNQGRNHPLYNALMMLCPWAQPDVELHMRFISFLAAAFVGAGLLYFPLRRKLPIAAVSGFVLWASNPDLLERSLHARGYGLAAAIALAQVWATCDWLKSRRPQAFALCVAALIPGCYTLPTYAFFGVPLAAIACLLTRPKNGLIGIAVAILILGLIWMPMLEDIFLTGYMYRQWFDSEFNFSSIGRAFSLYLLPLPDWGWLVLGPMLFGLPWAVRQRADNWIEGARVIMACTALYLAGLLLTGTAPIRTVTLVAIPIFTSVGICLQAIIQAAASGRTVIQGTAVILFLALGCTRLNNFKHIPGEDWKNAARFCRLLLPPGSTIDASRWGLNIFVYLRGHPLSIVNDKSVNPRESLAVPNSVLLNVPDPKDNSIDLIESAKWADMGVDLVLPGKYRPIWLHFVPNAPKQGDFIASDGGGRDVTTILTDQNWITAWPNGQSDGVLDIRLSKQAYSLLLLTPDGGTSLLPHSATFSSKGRDYPIDSTRFLQIGRAFVISLRDMPPGTLRIKWQTPPLISELRAYR